MESRFFNILTSGIVETDTAIEGAVLEYSDNAVVKLPGVADRLNDIETLMYANASEALSVSVVDLERYIKLLALESYNEISIKAMESKTDLPAEEMNVLAINSLTNSIGYSLRLIEDIKNPLADSMRDALEGYLYLMSKGAIFDMDSTMHSTTEALHVVLESFVESELAEIEYEENVVVGMESAIIQATTEVDVENHVDLIASMTEACESIYDSACENLIYLEGDRNTLFDTAMEVMLGRRQLQENNRVDDLKKRMNEIKSNGKKYISELRKTQMDLDIERSRNNNLRISKRLERKVDKGRYNVDDDITTIETKLKELNGLDHKNPENQRQIENLIRDIESTYNSAKSAADNSRSKETKIIEGARDRQLKKASKGSFGERALNRLGNALKSGADKAGKFIDRRHGEAYRKVDRDLREGKITEEEAKARYKKIEASEKRGKAFGETLVKKANSADQRITSKTDEMKAARDKIVADGGKLYRDKDLVEKDIREANKQATEKKTKKEKVPVDKTKIEEKKPKTTPKDTSDKEEIVTPKDKSLFVENWGALSPEQQKTIKKLRSHFTDAYNKLTKTNPSDSSYVDIKKMYDTRLDLLRRKLKEVSASGASGSTDAKSQEKSKSRRGRNKGTSELRESLSEADRKNYDNLLNRMTQFSEAVKKLEDKKDRTAAEETKLVELKDKLTDAHQKYNSFVKRHQAMQAAGESIANNLFENIDVLQYAINEGYSVYDMTEMTSEAFESFISGIEDQIYEDCYIVAMEAVKEQESRKERKAREAAEKKAAKKAKEDAIRKERTDAREKVIEYANTTIANLDDVRAKIGKEYAKYSKDIDNLSERAANGNLRGIRNARERRVVKKSYGGGKYDLASYGQLLKDLKNATKDIEDFVKSKEFIDGYDKTDKPTKDYKAAVKKINQIVGEVTDSGALLSKFKLNRTISKTEKKLGDVGKVLDSSSVVQHEREDKAAYREKMLEEAQKKDRKNNPDKYKLKETKSEYDSYLKRKAELDKKQADERAKKTSTVSPAEVSSAEEGMELPTCVESIEDFEVDVDCLLLDLRETLIDPEIFFGEQVSSNDMM